MTTNALNQCECAGLNGCLCYEGTAQCSCSNPNQEYDDGFWPCLNCTPPVAEQPEGAVDLTELSNEMLIGLVVNPDIAEGHGLSRESVLGESKRRLENESLLATTPASQDGRLSDEEKAQLELDDAEGVYSHNRTHLIRAVTRAAEDKKDAYWNAAILTLQRTNFVLSDEVLALRAEVAQANAFYEGSAEEARVALHLAVQLQGEKAEMQREWHDEMTRNTNLLATRDALMKAGQAVVEDCQYCMAERRGTGRCFGVHVPLSAAIATVRDHE